MVVCRPPRLKPIAYRGEIRQQRREEERTPCKEKMQSELNIDRRTWSKEVRGVRRGPKQPPENLWTEVKGQGTINHHAWWGLNSSVSQTDERTWPERGLKKIVASVFYYRVERPEAAQPPELRTNSALAPARPYSNEHLCHLTSHCKHRNTFMIINSQDWWMKRWQQRLPGVISIP